MLLLRSNITWKEFIEESSSPMIIFPASRSVDTAETNLKRTNDLAVSARIEEYSVRGLKSDAGDLFVLVRANESQVVGFVRNLLNQNKLGEPWFLFRRASNEPAMFEVGNGRREICTMTDVGFELPDGRVFVIVAMYHPAQNNTAMLHSRGHDVGDHL